VHCQVLKNGIGLCASLFTLLCSIILLCIALVLLLDINRSTSTAATFPESHKLGDVKFISLEPLHFDPEFI
jgi:hypothetical protein